MWVVLIGIGNGQRLKKEKPCLVLLTPDKVKVRPKTRQTSPSDIECFSPCTCEMINFSRVELGVRRVRRGVPDALEGLGGKRRAD